MTKYIKYQGNYIEVVDALGLPPAFYHNSKKNDYLKQIEKDLNRTFPGDNTFDKQEGVHSHLV